MKTNDSKSTWPAELVQYKEILDANPNYTSLSEEDKIGIAERGLLDILGDRFHVKS